MPGHCTVLEAFGLTLPCPTTTTTFQFELQPVGIMTLLLGALLREGMPLLATRASPVKGGSIRREMRGSNIEVSSKDFGLLFLLPFSHLKILGLFFFHLFYPLVPL